MHLPSIKTDYSLQDAAHFTSYFTDLSSRPTYMTMAESDRTQPYSTYCNVCQMSCPCFCSFYSQQTPMNFQDRSFSRKSKLVPDKDRITNFCTSSALKYDIYSKERHANLEKAVNERKKSLYKKIKSEPKQAQCGAGTYSDYSNGDTGISKQNTFSQFCSSDNEDTFCCNNYQGSSSPPLCACGKSTFCTSCKVITPCEECPSTEAITGLSKCPKCTCTLICPYCPCGRSLYCVKCEEIRPCNCEQYQKQPKCTSCNNILESTRCEHPTYCWNCEEHKDCHLCLIPKTLRKRLYSKDSRKQQKSHSKYSKREEHSSNDTLVASRPCKKNHNSKVTSISKRSRKRSSKRQPSIKGGHFVIEIVDRSDCRKKKKSKSNKGKSIVRRISAKSANQYTVNSLKASPNKKRFSITNC